MSARGQDAWQLSPAMKVVARRSGVLELLNPLEIATGEVRTGPRSGLSVSVTPHSDRGLSIEIAPV